MWIISEFGVIIVYRGSVPFPSTPPLGKHRSDTISIRPFFHAERENFPYLRTLLNYLVHGDNNFLHLYEIPI